MDTLTRAALKAAGEHIPDEPQAHTFKTPLTPEILARYLRGHEIAPELLKVIAPGGRGESPRYIYNEEGNIVIGDSLTPSLPENPQVLIDEDNQRLTIGGPISLQSDDGKTILELPGIIIDLETLEGIANFAGITLNSEGDIQKNKLRVLGNFAVQLLPKGEQEEVRNDLYEGLRLLEWIKRNK